MKEKIKRNGNHISTASSTSQFAKTSKSISNKWTSQIIESKPIEESFKIAEIQMQKMQKRIYDLTTVIEDNKKMINDLQENNSELVHKNNELNNSITILKKIKNALLIKLTSKNNELSSGNKGGGCILYNANVDKKIDEPQRKNGCSNAEIA